MIRFWRWKRRTEPRRGRRITDESLDDKRARKRKVTKPVYLLSAEREGGWGWGNGGAKNTKMKSNDWPGEGKRREYPMWWLVDLSPKHGRWFWTTCTCCATLGKRRDHSVSYKFFYVSRRHEYYWLNAWNAESIRIPTTRRDDSPTYAQKVLGTIDRRESTNEFNENPNPLPDGAAAVKSRSSGDGGRRRTWRLFRYR